MHSKWVTYLRVADDPNLICDPAGYHKTHGAHSLSDPQLLLPPLDQEVLIRHHRLNKPMT
jgi:hypothetical protein